MTVTATASTREPKGSPTRWRDDLGVVHGRQHRPAEQDADEHEHDDRRLRPR